MDVVGLGSLITGICRTWGKVCGTDRTQQDTQDLGKVHMGWNGHGRLRNFCLGTCRTWGKVCGTDRTQRDTQNLGKVHMGWNGHGRLGISYD